MNSSLCAQQAHGSILLFGQQACPVIFGARSSNVKSPDFCKNFNDMVFERLKRMGGAIPVIIINRASAYIEPGERLMFFGGRPPEQPAKRRAIYERHMIDSLCRIAATNPVHVVLPVPEMPVDVPAVLARELILTGKGSIPSTPLSTYHEANSAMISALHKAQQTCGIHLLDPVPYLCSNEACHGVASGRPLYSDNNHLSKTGASRLAPLFARVWDGSR